MSLYKESIVNNKIEEERGNIIKLGLQENFPNKLGKSINRVVYNSHRSNTEIVDQVNTWFEKYISYLDISEREFLGGFSNSYGQRVFELVMANFVVDKFKMKARSDEEKQSGKLPDLEFFWNSKSYFFEITTRSTNFVPDWYKASPDFSKYFSVAKVFYRVLQRNLEELDYIKGEWDMNLVNISRNFSEEEKIFVLNKLNIPGNVKQLNDEHLRSFNLWIKEQIYALNNFSEFLPDEKKEKLKEVGITGGFYPLRERESEDFFEMLAKFVAQAIVDKLRKPYFQSETPVVVSISLSLINDGRMICSSETIFDVIAKALPEALESVALEKSESPEKVKDLQESLENLYAVIIDTTWYNWFPAIQGAKMPQGYNNCYGVIYNKNISQEIRSKSDERIFDGLVPYSAELDLHVSKF